MLDAQIAELERSVRTDPDDAKTHLRLGHVLERAGEASQADRAFAVAARLEPADPTPHYCSGRLWEAEGDLWRAMRAYDAAMAHDPARRGGPADSPLLARAAQLGESLVDVAEGRASPVAHLAVSLIAYLNEYGTRTLGERVPFGGVEREAVRVVGEAIGRADELSAAAVPLENYARSFPHTLVGPRLAVRLGHRGGGRMRDESVTFRAPEGYLAVSHALRAPAVRAALSALVRASGPRVSCPVCKRGPQPGVYLPCAEGLVHWNLFYCASCGEFIARPRPIALAARPASDLMPLLRMAGLVEHLVAAIGLERIHLRLHPRRLDRMRVRDLLGHVCDLTVGRLWPGREALAAPFDYGDLIASIDGKPLAERMPLSRLPRRRIDLTFAGRAALDAQQAAAAIAKRFWGDSAPAA